MRIVFFGTPEYVLPILEKINRNFSRRGISPIVAVVTQPPRPTGRKQMLVYSPVDSWAFQKGIPAFHDPQQILKEDLKADLGILASYGAIVTSSILDLFPFGILNVHPSLLPKWRGASPIQAPIIAGEKETGVSIIKLDEKVDHGQIVSQFKENFRDEDTAGSARIRFFERSADVLIQLIEPYLKGKITLREQNHKDATFTTQIKKEDAFIPPNYLEHAMQGKSVKGKWKFEFLKDFSISPTPDAIERFIRAMDPWPMAWTYVQLGKSGHEKDKSRLKILKAHTEESKLVLETVQLEGKGNVSWKQFTEAYKNHSFEV